MKSGYGRGYYGVGQLAQDPPRKKSWFTVVVVLGVGAAAVWFLWPRNKGVPNLGPMGKDPVQPAPVTVTNEAPGQLAPAQAVQLAPAQAVQLAQLAPVQPGLAQLPSGPPTGAFLKQLEDEARARHFLTVKDYEDSMVNNARNLQAAGVKVVLAPHLQHLAPRLGS